MFTSKLKLFTKVFLMAFVFIRVAISAANFLEHVYSFVIVTSVDKENNEHFKHPLYTICPIFNNSANIYDSEATLYSVMVENSAPLPNTYVHLMLSNIGNLPVMSTTWLKTHDPDSPSRTILVQCQTYSYQGYVTPGKFSGRVSV